MRQFLIILLLISTPQYGNTSNTINSEYPNNCSVNHDIYMKVIPESSIPNNETEYEDFAKCLCERWPCLKPTFIHDHTMNKTLVFCSPKKAIMGGYCPEWKKGILQVRYTAPCVNFSSPCPLKYNIWESYKYRGCFINDSEEEQKKECMADYTTVNTLAVICIVGIILNICICCRCYSIIYILWNKCRHLCCGKKKEQKGSSSTNVSLTDIARETSEAFGEDGTENSGMRNKDTPELKKDGENGTENDHAIGGKEETMEDGTLNDQSDVPEEYGEIKPFLQP